MNRHISGEKSSNREVRIAIITDAVYAIDQGHPVSIDGVNGDEQWRRYQADGLRYRVYGRLRKNADEARGTPLRSVSLVPLTDYTGLVQGLRKYSQIRKEVGLALTEENGVILRMPGLISVLIYPVLRRRRIPYVVEVVGDIADLYSNSAGLINRLQKPVITRIVKSIIRNAKAARYVTQTTLQNAYPSQGVVFGISNVQVPDEAFASAPRDMPKHLDSFRLLCVGTQEHDYKGHDTAIEALKLLGESGISAELTLVGTGRLSESLKEMANRLGVADRTNFVGQLPKSKVFEQYRSHHVLLQPSRTEGLPRTVIEAMSQAMPVVGSNVSGLPELLNPEFMFPPNDPQALHDSIVAILHSDTWHSESARSLEEARKYRYSELSERFREWIAVVRESLI